MTTTAIDRHARPSRLRGLVRSPILLSVLGALLIGSLMLLGAGGNPFQAYAAMVRGRVRVHPVAQHPDRRRPGGRHGASPSPSRCGPGVVNLGGEGQIVLGGITAAVVAASVALPDAALAASSRWPPGALAGGLLGAVPAVLENRLGVPLLVSSLLLSYPGGRLRLLPRAVPAPRPRHRPAAEPGVRRGLPDAGVRRHRVVRAGARGRRRRAGRAGRLRGRRSATRCGSPGTTAGSPSTRGRRPAHGDPADGHRRRHRRPDRRDGRHLGALPLHRRRAGGAGYTWTGLLAALLARANPLGTVAAGVFFAALQVGGFGMERETEVPRELSSILQATVIVILAAAVAATARRARTRKDTA